MTVGWEFSKGKSSWLFIAPGEVLSIIRPSAINCQSELLSAFFRYRQMSECHTVLLSSLDIHIHKIKWEGGGSCLKATGYPNFCHLPLCPFRSHSHLLIFMPSPLWFYGTFFFFLIKKPEIWSWWPLSIISIHFYSHADEVYFYFLAWACCISLATSAFVFASTVFLL